MFCGNHFCDAMNRSWEGALLMPRSGDHHLGEGIPLVRHTNLKGSNRVGGGKEEILCLVVVLHEHRNVSHKQITVLSML